MPDDASLGAERGWAGCECESGKGQEVIGFSALSIDQDDWMLRG